MTGEERLIEFRSDDHRRCTTTHPVLGQCWGIAGSDHPHYGSRNRKFADHPMSGHPQDRGCMCGDEVQL